MGLKNETFLKFMANQSYVQIEHLGKGSILSIVFVNINIIIVMIVMISSLKTYAYNVK